MTMAEHKLPPIHPGEILLEEFLKPMNLSQYRLAKDITVISRKFSGSKLNYPGYAGLHDHATDSDLHPS